jgi:hypothetical protein
MHEHEDLKKGTALEKEKNELISDTWCMKTHMISTVDGIW